MKTFLRIAALTSILFAAVCARAQSTDLSGTAQSSRIGLMQSGLGVTIGAGGVTQWKLQCPVPVFDFQSQDCGTNATNVLGVAQNVGTSVVTVIESGYVLIQSTTALTSASIGHIVCSSTNGTVADSGGTSTCPTGTEVIGIVRAINPVPGISTVLGDGTQFTPSPTTPLVKLTSAFSVPSAGACLGDINSSCSMVTGLNGVQLATLPVGILKNSSGVPSTAVAPDFPILNQNTTGSSAGFTGLLNGDVTGLQGATVVGKINGVSLAGLPTGLIKNTTGTGVLSSATAGDVPVFCQLVPPSDIVSLVGTVNEIAFATHCLVPANTLDTGRVISVEGWFNVVSGTTPPNLTIRARYGGTGVDGTMVFNPSPGAQAASVTRSGVVDFFIASPTTLGPSVNLYGSGEWLYPSTLHSSQQSGVFTGQVTNSDENLYLTVSSTGGATGSQIQLLTLKAR